MNSKYDTLEITKEKNIKNNFLVIKNAHIDASCYEARILDEVEIENVMKYVKTYEEGKEVLKYDIKNMISLNDYLKLNSLKKKDLIFIINNIYNILSSIDNYLLSENSIMLDIRTLMISKDNDMISLKFCIIPLLEADFSYELSRLLVRLLRHIDTKDSEALDLAYKLFVKSSKRNYSISDLMQVIEDVELMENEKKLEAEEYERELEKERMAIDMSENLYYAYEDEKNAKEIKADIDNTESSVDMTMGNDDNASIKKVESDSDDGIEIDEDTKKDLNLTLFDKLDDGKVKDEKTLVLDTSKKKRHKLFHKKIMLNANIKFHVAIFPILALVIPLFAYFILGVKFFTEHYMLLVFYEVMIVLIISLNTLMDSIYKQC